jgi:hypothetical protein
VLGRINGNDLKNGPVLGVDKHRPQKLNRLFQVNGAETGKLRPQYFRENRNAQHSMNNGLLELRRRSIPGVEVNGVIVAGKVGECLYLLLREFEKMVECRVDNRFYLHKWVINFDGIEFQKYA